MSTEDEGSAVGRAESAEDVSEKDVARVEEREDQVAGDEAARGTSPDDAAAGGEPAVTDDEQASGAEVDAEQDTEPDAGPVTAGASASGTDVDEESTGGPGSGQESSPTPAEDGGEKGAGEPADVPGDPDPAEEGAEDPGDGPEAEGDGPVEARDAEPDDDGVPADEGPEREAQEGEAPEGHTAEREAAGREEPAGDTVDEGGDVAPSPPERDDDRPADGAERVSVSDGPGVGDPGGRDEPSDGAAPPHEGRSEAVPEEGRTAGEPSPVDADDEPTERAEDRTPAEATEQGAWHRLGAALKPGFSRSQVLAGVLCAALGFALVVQVQQSSSDQLSSARQDDLVRLLDEVTDRAEQLSTEVSQLEATRDELLSGSNRAASALELAQERAASEGILSGRLPAQGPGVRLRITDPGGSLEAAQLFNVLEELRNAGAEVVALNGVRLITTTWFRDQDGAIVVDGHTLEAPYEWTVIGDPDTLDRALEIPGGALATVRNAGANASTTQRDEVTISEVREPTEPEHAKPRTDDD